MSTSDVSVIDIFPESKSYWDAAQEGRLLLPHCSDCDRSHWFPRPFCPFCASPNVTPREASGTGIIYSYSVVRSGQEPYVLAYITLDEGPTMLTNIVESNVEQVTIGDRVKVAFQPGAGGVYVPVFVRQGG